MQAPGEVASLQTGTPGGELHQCVALWRGFPGPAGEEAGCLLSSSHLVSAGNVNKHAPSFFAVVNLRSF